MILSTFVVLIECDHPLKVTSFINSNQDKGYVISWITVLVTPTRHYPSAMLMENSLVVVVYMVVLSANPFY